MMTISNTKKALLAVGFLFVSIAANAAVQASGGLNLMFINSINGMTQGWINPLVKIGIGIGVSFWLIESLVEIANQRLYNDGGALMMFVFKRSIIFGVSTGIFWKFDLYQNITELFLDPARTLSNFGADSGSFGLNPGDVWHQYTQWYLHDYNDLMKSLGTWDVSAKFGVVLYQIIYFLSAVFISFEIIILNLKFKLILFGGIIFAGCFSSGWAKQFWWKYVVSLVGISFQVLIFCLMYKAYKTSINYGSMKDAVANGVFTDNFLLQVIGCVIAALSLHYVPAYIGGAITGVGGGGLSGLEIAKSIGSSIKNAYNTARNESGGNSGGGSFGERNSTPSTQPPINKADKASAFK